MKCIFFVEKSNRPNEITKIENAEERNMKSQ